MKSVKKYSKKKSRVQQKVKSKVKSKVQPKVQARIQARSNKKQINKRVSRKVNKRVNKNIIRGTKKVQRNKNKKVTKKNLNSRVNVSGGGGRGEKSMFGRIFQRKRTAKEPVHTIFFDVDGTLGDTGCGGIMKPYIPRKREVLLTLLDDLKKKGVKLFILTRCGRGSNICKDDQLSTLEIRQCDYYEEIVEQMDGVFAADILNINVNDPSDTDKTERGGSAWATIKSMVMEKYCEHEQIQEKQRERVILIDDDSLNAIRASEFGFRSFHNNKSKIKGAALKMTNNALIEILDEIDPVTSTNRTFLKDKYKDSYTAVTPQKNEAKIKDYKTQLGNLKKYADQDQDQLVQQSEVEKFINKTVQRVLKGEKVQCKKPKLVKRYEPKKNLLLTYLDLESVGSELVFGNAMEADEELRYYLERLGEIPETANNSVIRCAFALYSSETKKKIFLKFKYRVHSSAGFGSRGEDIDITEDTGDTEFQDKMQEILKNPNVKNYIFNIIKKLKVKYGNIVFLPNIPEEFAGFGNNNNFNNPNNNVYGKFVTVNEQNEEIDLKKIQLSVEDFFMNGKEAKSALMKLSTSGFALYFGTTGFLCMYLKLGSVHFKTRLPNTDSVLLKEKGEIEAKIEEAKIEEIKSEDTEELKISLSELIIRAKNEVKKKLKDSPSATASATASTTASATDIKESIRLFLNQTLQENKLSFPPNKPVLVFFKKPTNDGEFNEFGEGEEANA